MLDVHLPFFAMPVWKRTLGSGENIVLLESTEPDDDVVPGEFDIY
jgi:hypothetical protein